MAEEARVEVRNARRDANEAIKVAKKNSELTEDEQKARTEEIQKLTDKMVAEVDKLSEAKQKELMEV